MADAATAAPGIGIPAQNPLAPAKDASALLSTSCIAREPPRKVSMLIAVNRHVQGDRQPCDLESPMRSQRGGGGRARFDREQMPRPSPPEVVGSASWRCRAWFRPLCRHADARPASAVRDQAGGLSGQIAL